MEHLVSPCSHGHIPTWRSAVSSGSSTRRALENADGADRGTPDNLGRWLGPRRNEAFLDGIDGC